MDKSCLDCKYCYIEDIWFEMVCKLHGYIGNEDRDKICKDFKPERTK